MSGVGLPTEGFTCAYSANLDDQACNAESEFHFIVHTPDWGNVALFSCKTHCNFAMASGTVLDGHFFTEACTTACAIGTIV